MKNWNEIGFKTEITGDGSVSLRLLTSSEPDRPLGEAMHHSGGAFAETELIYGDVIRLIFEKIPRPHFCVVGLGLGYIELIIAREAIAFQKEYFLTSFESVPELRENFIAALNSTDSNESSTEVEQTYHQVLSCVFKKKPEWQEKALQDLQLKLKEGAFQILSALGPEIPQIHGVNGFLYDAFSSKTTPHLWEEEFLNQLLQQTAAPDSVLSTYAAKGSLKRALRAQNYEVETLPGFQGKRNSTRGLRGQFLKNFLT